MKIDFEFETKYGWFRDALILDDNHTYTDEQIEEIKQLRLDNWISFIEASSNNLISGDANG